eukprot:gnl/TRDRNA2_/TRDRNA2_104918_c1_seq1.p1 gnl/TRDRNA2_/TRDRNA2_104918_c1~~gnl/TRDRNA2_/TRDRNA2_104918_c1_seq1.p1  ORF type:complete len:364 (+),score=35.52 gnl/TRDRNA2_/TRDRNA2_104918_c1_seq1:127-1092(+)
MTGLVGVKPTVGLVSRRHIVPISHSQDTAGPMARTVEDAARLLTVMAGTDPLDPATAHADARREDYVSLLDSQALRGKRLGVIRSATSFGNSAGGYETLVGLELDRALGHLRDAGAELVEITGFPHESEIQENELRVLLCELKAGLNAYLADAAPEVSVRSLADLIAFNDREAQRELVYFGQDLFLEAEKTNGLETEGYAETAEKNRRLAGEEGIDRLLAEYNLDALVAATAGPAWKADLVYGDHCLGSATTIPAVAGYPHVTVPMGQVHGLPVGLSFIGPAWSEARLFALSYAFEHRALARRRPTYEDSLPVAPRPLRLS